MKVGDRVRIVGDTDFAGRIGHLIAPDDPRITEEWSGWEPTNAVSDNWWVYLVEAFTDSGAYLTPHHTWQFNKRAYEVIESYPEFTSVSDVEAFLNG